MPIKLNDNEKNIHKDHRQRLRARFRSEGLEGFQPHEILELLLFYSIPQQNTNPLGHRLIKEFGSIAGVFNADYNALMRVDGIKEYSATLIKLIPELCSCYRASAAKFGEKLERLEDIAKFCLCKYMTVKTERLSVVMFDSEMHLLGMETLSDGGTESVKFDFELLASRLFASNCTNFLLVHNHLSGSLRPSPQDILITKKVESFMSHFNKTLIDHFILSKTSYLPIMNMSDYYDIKVEDIEF